MGDCHQQAHEEENPHLHELGTSDTLVDICGFFISADLLGIENFFCSPLPVIVYDNSNISIQPLMLSSPDNKNHLHDEKNSHIGTHLLLVYTILHCLICSV